MKKQTLSWILQVVVAITYLQTLFFKFSAHPDSIHIFSTLGLEPFGRIGIGIAELLVATLLLIPSLRVWGALLSIGIIAGAIAAHLGPLGIEVNGDGGKVFALALLVLASSVALVVLHRDTVKTILQTWRR